MVKIIGTGKLLEKDKEYEVTKEMAELIVSVGRARFATDNVVVQDKEKKEQVEAKEKVEVTAPKKRNGKQ